MPGIIYIGVLALAASAVAQLWRSTKQRRYLWRLYELRDDLRRLGIDNRELADDPGFAALDRYITTICWGYRAQCLSIWHALGGRFFNHPGLRELAREEALLVDSFCKKDPTAAWIFERSVANFGWLLAWRHMAAIALVAPTVLPVLFLWVGRKELARAVFLKTGREPLGTHIVSA